MQDTAEATDRGSMVAEAEAQALNKNDILIILQSSDVITRHEYIYTARDQVRSKQRLTGVTAVTVMSR